MPRLPYFSVQYTREFLCLSICLYATRREMQHKNYSSVNMLQNSHPSSSFQSAGELTDFNFFFFEIRRMTSSDDLQIFICCNQYLLKEVLFFTLFTWISGKIRFVCRDKLLNSFADEENELWTSSSSPILHEILIFQVKCISTNASNSTQVERKWSIEYHC